MKLTDSIVKKTIVLFNMKLTELLPVAREELKDFTTVANPDFRLEEAEYDQDKKAWNVVVSYLAENTNKKILSAPALLPEFQYHRIYQKIRINDHKAVIGLYIYKN